MGRRRRTTSGESLLDLLLEAPWPASVVVGVAAYAFLKWVLPALAGDNLFLKPMSSALANLAGWAAAFFFLIGALVYVKSAAARKKASALRMPNKTVAHSASARRHASRAEPGSSGRVEPVAGGGPVMGGPSGEPPEQSAGRPQAAQTVDPFSQIAVQRHQSGSHADSAKPSAWSIDLIREIEWKRFEDLCQKFYEAKGIKSATTALGPDGGIDIRLYCDDGKPLSIVQCKAWNDRYVGVKPVRELLGVMTHEKIEKAFFMTSGRFSDDAKEVAKSNRITLIDGEMFLMMLKRLPETSRTELLEFATGGDYKTPTCPKCGITMKRVEGKTGRPDFWGCHSYPRCRQILPMRRDAS